MATQPLDYNPPPNFAKEDDTRYAAYVEQFGEKCWELDALSPTVIADLIRSEIEDMIDDAAWRKCEAAEKRNRALLGRVSENWTKGQESGGRALIAASPLPSIQMAIRRCCGGSHSAANGSGLLQTTAAPATPLYGLPCPPPHFHCQARREAASSLKTMSGATSACPHSASEPQQGRSEIGIDLFRPSCRATA